MVVGKKLVAKHLLPSCWPGQLAFQTTHKDIAHKVALEKKKNQDAGKADQE